MAKKTGKGKERKQRQKKRDEQRGITRGAKGGVKHQPGRGHEPRSAIRRKKRFARKAAKRRQREEEKARQDREAWEALPEEVQKMRPELQPKSPRPPHDR